MNNSPNSVAGPVFIQTLSILFLTVLIIPAAFADRAQALMAQEQGDYHKAAKLWLPLANDGDPVAQFNLALLYQQGEGVMADENLSRYWFSMAARQGMAEAYADINPHAIKPTTQTSHVTLTLGPQAWVAAQKPGDYTLQLASSSNKALIQKYYNDNNLAGKAGYYHSRRSGEDWYSLVYGAYPSVQAAKAAIGNLPTNLKKWSPWVRNIKSIHKIMIK
ncbi:MAG: SPOR domain-containing protein [Gammaproteobacteria bacterium]|jgi:TPR repeat protein